MVRISKAVFDAAGTIVARGALPLNFDTTADATDFMERYLALVFAGGKSGYQRDDESWWGCDDTLDLELHRYRIEH